MTADGFVRELKQRQPSKEQLAQDDWPESMWDELRNSYECPPRPVALGMESQDALVDLIDRYDTSHIEISFIRFHDIPSAIELPEHGNVLVFAVLDADYLGSCFDTGRIVFLDGNNPRYVMETVAVDGSHFLAALIELIDSKRHQADVVHAAAHCAKIAGIPQAKGFFELMTG